MRLSALLLTLGLILGMTGTALAAESTGNGEQEISRVESRPSAKGMNTFTGNVRVDNLFRAKDSAPYQASYVTFEPGARSFWHVHTAGQHLVVTQGVGLTGMWNGPVWEIKAGDVIWCPPGVKHWHGAAPDKSMTHMAITGIAGDGSNTKWEEEVTDAQYAKNRSNAMLKVIPILSVLLLLSMATVACAATADKLDPKQRAIVTISAFTSNGNLEKLKNSLNEGLDAGLTVNEIKEVLVQMYAYTGFPRSLNAVNTFMAVLEERQQKGIRDEAGKEPSAMPPDFDRDRYGAETRAKIGGRADIPPPSGYQVFVPVIDSFLKEHLFADIFYRDNLDWQTRELATISALAAMEGTSGQMRFHFGGAMNMGITEAQMNDFISVIRSAVGGREADAAQAVLTQVLDSRKGTRQ